MRIAVLDLTEELPDLLAGLPRVSAQIVSWLEPALPEAVFTAHDISGGADLPTIDGFDGVILSGSEYGVYDDTPWMQPLRAFLIDARRAGKAIFGICFGHQIMADVFGGKAELSAMGTVLGARDFEMDGTRRAAHVWHQDQVTASPPGAEVIAQAPYCPIAALRYDFPAFSVQFHPEYTRAHLERIFARARGVFVTDAQVDAAVASFETTPVAADLMAAEVADFFHKHVK